MRNAAEVRSAYLAQEDSISLDLVDCQTAREESRLADKFRSAQLQTEAAHKQMWIIHWEEQAQ